MRRRFRLGHLAFFALSFYLWLTEWMSARCLLAGRMGLSTGDPKLYRGRHPGRVCRPAGQTSASPWKILGLQRGTAKEEIKARYRELAATEHPDKRTDLEPTVASARFAEITSAYRDLMDKPDTEDSIASNWRDEVWEEVQPDVDPDSYVIFYAILLWVVVLLFLSNLDWFTWDDCYQTWQWWCSLKGN